MAEDVKKTEIAGSAIEQKQQQDAQKAIDDKAAADVQKAEDDKKAGESGDGKDGKGGEKDPSSDKFDITKNDEYQKLMTDLKAEQQKTATAKEAVTSFQERLDGIEKTKKEEERKSLSDVEKLQAQLQDMEDKQLDLLKRDQDRQSELDIHKAEIKKRELLEASDLSPDYWEFINGTDVDDVNAQISRFIDKLGKRDKATLEKVPEAVKNQQVGSSKTANPQNEGTQKQDGGIDTTGLPMPTQGEIDALKGSGNMADLEMFLMKYPHLKDDILPGG